MEFWNQRTFCLITGASRGIGKCIAIEFAKKLGPDSTMVLIARSADALEKTKAEIEGSCGKSVEVITCALDLGKPSGPEYQALIQSALNGCRAKAADYQHALLVHNAGSLGNIKLRVLEQDSLEDIQQYFTFNLFSMVLLSTEFFKVFSSNIPARSIVQISSLGAVKPFKTWGLYCAGKAARDSLLRSIAEEEDGINGISTFNYAPGPVETDIYTEAARDTGDSALREEFQSQRSQILTCEQTVGKLIRFLGEKKYTKGEHVDYYDDVVEVHN